MRIVIADDAVLLRAGLERLLTEAGHEVVAAVGGGNALLSAVSAHQPDLAVIDVVGTPEQPELKLVECAPGVTEEQVRELTGATLS